MINFLQRQRWKLDGWLTAKGLAHTFSLPVYQLFRNTWPLLNEHAEGQCLDAGSGRSPWKPRLREAGLEVLSIDLERRSEEVDFVGDIQCMPVVGNGSMRTVVCTQVLEHVARPWDALAEFRRVLQPGGMLILSVPHLSAIHEAPSDYFRYTQYGLKSLLENSGFQVRSIRESGGLVSFLGHPLSMLVLGIGGIAPGLRELAWIVNYVLLIRALQLVDWMIGMPRRYPCNYVVLAEKPQ
jgi:SAM-dependent methyltransferase